MHLHATILNTIRCNCTICFPVFSLEKKANVGSSFDCIRFLTVILSKAEARGIAKCQHNPDQSLIFLRLSQNRLPEAFSAGCPSSRASKWTPLSRRMPAHHREAVHLSIVGPTPKQVASKTCIRLDATASLCKLFLLTACFRTDHRLCPWYLVISPPEAKCRTRVTHK